MLIEHKEEKEGSRIVWRRNKVQELSSQGHSQREIAQVLQVSNGTVNRDLSYLRQQAKDNIQMYKGIKVGSLYCHYHFLSI